MWETDVGIKSFRSPHVCQSLWLIGVNETNTALLPHHIQAGRQERQFHDQNVELLVCSSCPPTPPPPPPLYSRTWNASELVSCLQLEPQLLQLCQINVKLSARPNCASCSAWQYKTCGFSFAVAVSQLFFWFVLVWVSFSAFNISSNPHLALPVFHLSLPPAVDAWHPVFHFLTRVHAHIKPVMPRSPPPPLLFSFVVKLQQYLVS